MDYGLGALMGDLEAVLDGAGARAPVHLVGHDWGSVQGWEAVIGDRLRGRIASFMSISGPDRRHMARWAREAVRSGPRGVAEVLGQARRSVYMPVLMAPRVGEAAARVLAAGFGRTMRLREGADPRSGHPAETLRADARNGLGLYRANMRRGSGPAGDGRTDVPVQLIVPVKDRYGSQSLLLSARGAVPRLYVRRAPAGHWVARSHLTSSPVGSASSWSTSRAGRRHLGWPTRARRDSPARTSGRSRRHHGCGQRYRTSHRPCLRRRRGTGGRRRYR